jgi:hypothetical protein
VFYQANRRCPIFAELQGLVVKTAGVADVLRAALAPLVDRIVVAFVFGSFASGEPRKTSDVDVVVVGDAMFGAIVSALSAAQEKLVVEGKAMCYGIRELTAPRVLRSSTMGTSLCPSRVCRCLLGPSP